MKTKPALTLIGVAAQNGLTVEYSNGLPSQLDGFLDPYDTPRYIVVNQNLSAGEQAFVIAREIGYRWQQQRVRSFVFDKLWKWEVLNHASDAELKKIYQLDAELRGNWIMLGYATRDEFCDFIKQNPKRWLKLLLNDNLAAFHLQKIRVRIFRDRLRRVFAFA